MAAKIDDWGLGTVFRFLLYAALVFRLGPSSDGVWVSLFKSYVVSPRDLSAKPILFGVRAAD